MKIESSFVNYMRPCARMVHGENKNRLAPSMKDTLRNVIGAGDLIQWLTTKPLIATGYKTSIMTSNSKPTGLTETDDQRFPRSTSTPNKTVHEKRSR